MGGIGAGLGLHDPCFADGPRRARSGAPGQQPATEPARPLSTLPRATRSVASLSTALEHAERAAAVRIVSARSSAEPLLAAASRNG